MEVSRRVSTRHVRVRTPHDSLEATGYDFGRTTLVPYQLCGKIASMTTTLTTWAALGLGAFSIAALPAQTPASAESAVREAYATVPGARIFYRDTGGSGAPVILLH